MPQTHAIKRPVTGRPPADQAFVADVAEKIRRDTVAGIKEQEIAERYAIPLSRLHSFVQRRRAAWLRADAARRAAEKNGHTVIEKDGRPVTLPYITMHALALAEARSNAA